MHGQASPSPPSSLQPSLAPIAAGSHLRALARLAQWALVLALLALALLAPARSLAQARRESCPATPRAGAAHARAARACRKGSPRPAKREAAKRRAAHARAQSHAGKARVRAKPPAMTPARCEDESLPVRAADGSFTCADGSEPACEDGATPAPSKNSTSLLCAVSSTSEASGGEDECPAEGEAEGACEAAPGCEGQSGEASCEGEGEV